MHPGLSYVDSHLQLRRRRNRDKQVNNAVVGHSMSTDSSSMAQAMVHNEVRLNLLQSDAKAFNTLSRYFVRPSCDINFAPGRPYHFGHRWLPQRWPEKKADVFFTTETRSRSPYATSSVAMKWHSIPTVLTAPSTSTAAKSKTPPGRCRFTSERVKTARWAIAL